MDFRNEKLIVFCFIYGCLGHIEPMCNRIYDHLDGNVFASQLLSMCQLSPSPFFFFFSFLSFNYKPVVKLNLQYFLSVIIL